MEPLMLRFTLRRILQVVPTIVVVALALVTCLVALPETKGRPLDA